MKKKYNTLDITNKDIQLNKQNNKNIELITERIKIIENQIEVLNQTKPLFLQTKKIKKHKKRINNLEEIKEKLYKELEIETDNN